MRQATRSRTTHAAAILSGSQNAASSFSLNSGNRDPKGIVTDGTHLWVVNNNSTDKVFKYTLNGSLVGSWTIDSANQSPTGLTIDPTNASQDIWIVDSGTDRVYQYSDGRSRTSDSASASVTFNLAPGNANPQGIADPPSPGLTVSSSAVLLETTGAALTAVGNWTPRPVNGEFRPEWEQRAFDRRQSKAPHIDERRGEPGSPETVAPRLTGPSAPGEHRRAVRPERGEHESHFDDDLGDLLGLIAEDVAGRYLPAN